jgi:zinc protease
VRIHRARIGANVLPIKMGKLQPFISGLIPVLLVAVSSVSAQIQPGQLAKTPPGQQAKPSDTANPAQLVPQMPPAEAARLYKFPPVASKTLANGMRVFVVNSPAMPAVSVHLVLTAAGSVNDPQGRPGVAAMAANLLTQGTDKRTAQQIADSIDFVGGSLGANSSDDSTAVSVTVVKKDFDLAMDLLSDITLHANFRAEELERQRQQLVSNLQVNYDDADYLASAAFQRVVFGQHPYGLPNEGTPASAPTISRDDVLKFRDTYYSPNTALLAFAGDISPEAAFAAAEKYFGAWETKTAPPAAAPPPQTTSGLHVIVIDKPDAVQTQIRVGKIGVRRADPDFIPLYVANRVFGGGYNSRLNTEVRIKKGLTYGASSIFDTRMLGGSFLATTFTRTEATMDALRLVVDLMKGMSQKNVKPEELKFAEDYLVGVYPIQTETPDEVAGRVLEWAHYSLAADYNETYQARIAAVTLDQVNAMGAKYFDPASLDIIVAGNASQFRDALKKEFPSAIYDEIPAAQLDLGQPDLRKYVEVVPAATPESIADGRSELAAAAQAAGGDALAKVQSVESTASGRISMGANELPFEAKIYVIYPDHLRIDTKIPLGDVTQGWDGKTGWVGNAQSSQAVPAEQDSEFVRTLMLFGGWGLFRDVASGKTQAQSLGSRDLMGVKSDAIAVTAGDLHIIVYLDPASHLLVGARYTQDTQQGKVESVQVWSDFHDVQGMKFPFHSITYRAGARFSETSVKDMRLNTNPDPSLFVKPQK